MSDYIVAYRQISDRTFFGKLAKTIFILMNLLMAYLFYSNVRDAPGSNDGLGAQLGFGLANIGLLMFWGLLNVVIGTVVLLTRRKRMVPAEDLLTIKRQEKRFREQENVRGYAIALVAWIFYTAAAGAWPATLVGLAAGALIVWFFYRGRGARLIDDINHARDAETPRSTSRTFGRRASRNEPPNVNRP